MTRAWTVRLVVTAERDFREIIQRSEQDFGPQQAAVYAQTLALAMEALHKNGPMTIGTRKREEIGPGIYSLHAARSRRRSSHFLIFRVLESRTIEVLRILHDRMDLARHIPPVAP